jgi:hypothetical protein
MRVLIFSLILFYSGHAQAQKFDLFEIENGELVWRNTYAYEGAEDSLRREVVTMLKSKVFTQQVVRNEIGYNGEIKHYQVDCKRYGRSYSNTPLIYWDGEWSGKFVIEVRDNRYRVTIYGLYFENKVQPTSHYPIKTPRKGYYLNEVWKKGPEFKKSVLPDMALMSLALRDSFDIMKSTSPITTWDD